MTDASDFIPVFFAKNIEEAEFYKTLLEDHDIRAIIDEDGTMVDIEESGGDIGVLVPSDQLEEAELILEQRSNLDDDFDEELEDFDEEEDEFDDFSKIDPDEEVSEDFEVDDLEDEEDDF